MVRKSAMKEARMRIEHAMRACSDMNEIRIHLVRALNALGAREARAEKRIPLQKPMEIPQIGRENAAAALEDIEAMISDEKRKLGAEGEKGLLNG